jgi:hypothetical protein
VIASSHRHYAIAERWRGDGRTVRRASSGNERNAQRSLIFDMESVACEAR